MGGERILLLGGARSGKSALAVRWALALGGPRVSFIATARAIDDEMRQRIARHRAQRPPAWESREAPRAVADALLRARHPVVVIDCLTLLVANALLEEGPTAVTEEVEALLHALRAGDKTVLLVSNEVGLGIVPDNPLARAYRDMLGWANQQMRAMATRTYFLVAGGVLPVVEPPATP